MMDQEQLQRLMRLARRTKNPLIMTDPGGRSPMVLMDVDHYEQLIGAGTSEVHHRQEAFPMAVDESWHVEVKQVDEAHNLADSEEEEAWSLDELPEEFFAEPPLESMATMTPEMDHSSGHEPKEQETQPEEPTIEPLEEQEAQETKGDSDEEDPGEEQFYLEPIE